MFLVYCSCPGVSARMNFRLAVAKYRYATSIVMPCSRSALRPSVKSEKSIGPAVRLRDAAGGADAKESGHQKYPSRFFISIEPS
jgi:hypothetical protein